MSASVAAESGLFHALNGIPRVNIARNLQIALAQGRHVTSLLREVIALRRGAGRLAPAEYFYYRLWDADLPMAEKRRFVGKQAQHPMHLTCNNPHWYGSAADKILFHTIMTGEGLPLPELLAITQAGRHVKAGLPLTDGATVAAFLRQKEIYPLFAKPTAGKYSLSVLSADAHDPATDEVILLGGERREVDLLAASLVGGAGYLLQRRLFPHRQLKTHFGPRLWSLRVLVLLAGGEPVIHRAAAKIATGHNPADNYWRPGNMLGAVDLETGRITRTVRGTGADLAINENHPDTDKPVIGTAIPEWERLLRLVKQAAPVFAGIRTQSWDVALTDRGPVFLEVNFGGDLNLHQLAHGAGVLDPVYEAHLRRCGYRLR
jgi:hypothetical protein